MKLLLSRSPRAVVPAGVSFPLGARDAALLAWLALEGPTPRARLVQLLWPATEPDTARNALRQRLFHLRRQLGAEVVSGKATLALADGVTHDLADADSVLGDAVHDHSPEFGAWLAQQRERRAGRLRGARVALAERAERSRDWADALLQARELLALEPTSEAAHRRVVRLHYLAGDRAAALLAFDACERMLKHEVGVRPSPETLELLATIEAGAPRAGTGAGAVVPASLLRPPRLAGRGAEWALLTTAWQAQQVALIEGEAGLGKSRLLSDLARRDPDHAIAVSARPGDPAVPYAGLMRLARAAGARLGDALPDAARRQLARLLPELGEAPAAGGEGDGARFAAALESLFAAIARAGVHGVLFDDLHYLDDASAEALRGLAGADPALAWVLAYRPAELPPAARALTDTLVQARHARVLPLAPLRAAAIAELVDSLALPGIDGAALAPRLLRHTGGNPLYVLETVKAMLGQGGAAPAGMPVVASVAQLIGQRIARLSPDAVKLARCAAVAGQDFSSELATHLLGARPLDLADAWTELEDAHVLRDQAFAHDLVHETALASVPPALARQLRGQIAEFLAARGGAPERIAAHWIGSASPLAAVPCLLEAGHRANRTLRKREARDAFVQAVDLLQRAGDTQGAFGALDAYFDCARPMWDDDGRTLAQRLEQLAYSPVQQARAGLRRAELAARSGDFAASGAAADEALRRFAPAQAPALAATLMSFAAGAKIHAGDTAGAVLGMYRAVEIAETSGDEDCLTTAVATLGATLDWAGRYAEAYLHSLRGLELARKHGEPVPIIASAINCASNRVEVGRLADARALFELVDRVAASHEVDLAEEWPVALAQRARVMLDLGEFTLAVRLHEDALALFARRMPHWLIAVQNAVTTQWMRLGQWARAQQSARSALALCDAALPIYAARARLLAAEVEAALGQREGQLPALEQAEGTLAGASLRASRQLALARAQWVAPAEGLALARQVRDGARAEGVQGLALDAEVRASAAAARGGDSAAAAAHARAALSLFDEVEPQNLYRAEVWLVAVQALQAVDAQQSAAVLAQALRWVRDTAERRVPAEFRDSFLHRNPVNRELLALGARLGVAG